MTEVLGFVAGSMTTMAFVPQVLKAYRTRSTNDLSLMMLASFSVGLVLWVIYGIRVGRMPIIATNTVTLALVLVLLYVKLAPSQKLL